MKFGTLLQFPLVENNFIRIAVVQEVVRECLKRLLNILIVVPNAEFIFQRRLDELPLPIHFLHGSVEAMQSERTSGRCSGTCINPNKNLGALPCHTGIAFVL